jgi:hypothetical protein
MIFHGVYTTPQIIDSTLSTTSNNAVNGKAVSDYVEAQMANVGGGCSICREDVFLPYTGWEFRFEVTKSQAIILGKHVKLYIEFVARWQSDRNTVIESVIGTLKDDIPPLDSNVEVIFPWISQDREIPATLSGSELRFVQGEGLSTIMQNDTFPGTIEWGAPETGPARIDHGNKLLYVFGNWQPASSTVKVFTFGSVVTIHLYLYMNGSVSMDGNYTLIAQIADDVPKSSEGIIFFARTNQYEIITLSLSINTIRILKRTEPLTGTYLIGVVTYIANA